MEVTWLAAAGAIHRHNVAKCHAQCPQPRHAECSHREIFVVRVHFHLHRAAQVHLVLLVIRGHGPLHFSLEIGVQHIRLFLLKPQDGVVRLKRDELSVAVHQAQRIHGGIIFPAMVERRFQCLPGLSLTTHAHQIDAQIRIGGIQMRVCRYGLLVVLDPFVIATVHDQEVRYRFEAAPVVRILGHHLVEPGLRGAVTQQLH